MEANSSTTGPEPFRLFDEKSQSGLGFGLGFLDGPEKPPPPPPPCIEVLPSQVSSNVEFNVEPVDLNGLTLLKGRVSTKEVFGLSNSDLIPENMKLGCGHGLPGIFACLKGARAVHFQDFNVEVLQCLTIPNVNANIQQKLSATANNNSAEVRFFASDWNEAHLILPHVPTDDGGTKNGEAVDQAAGYDIILMAETVYSVSTLPGLYKLIKKCLRSPHGIVYLAAKKHYFGVGGGSRRFISIVEKDGVLAASLVAEVTDGSSNVREVWKLHFK